MSGRHLALIEGGLTQNQAKIYEALVAHGVLPASTAARLANVPRTLGYKALGELVGLGLVAKTDNPGEVATFAAAHPLKLKELADKRYEDAKDARVALDGVLSKLISEFNTITGTPGVRILEGVAGVVELYEDQLNEGQNIRLIRSLHDRDVPELIEIVRKQITAQAEAKIHVRAITPLTEFVTAAVIATDAERLVERRLVPADALAIPAQIVIYANKVAITAYKNGIITTIIENPAIKTTFEMIFEYMWKLSEADHNLIMEKLRK